MEERTRQISNRPPESPRNRDLETRGIGFYDGSTGEFLSTREEPVIKCPKCSSVFVNKKECEACGYQFGVDRLGEPFGLESFFNIKEEYLFTHGRYFQWVDLGFRPKARIFRKYRGALLRRYQILMSFFERSLEGNIEELERRKLFLFEAKEIISDYWRYGGSLSQLWVMTESLEHHPFYSSLVESLKKFEQKERPSFRFSQLMSFDSEALFQRYWVLMKMIIGGGAVLGAGYLLLKLLLG